MSLWDLALFAGASFLALRSLISLMVIHKDQYKDDLLRKQLQQQAEFESTHAVEEQQSAESEHIESGGVPASAA